MKLKYVVSSIMVLLLQGLCINAYAAASHSMPTTLDKQKGSDKDAEIIALLIAVDKNEMAAAKKSIKKSTSPAIKEYSNMLYQEHKNNLDEAMKISKQTGIRPVQTSKTMSLKEDGKKDMAAFSSLKGKEFDKAFIAAMVKGHRGVLVILNKERATNPEVRKLVQTTTPAVKHHLQMAQKIQKDERKH